MGTETGTPGRMVGMGEGRSAGEDAPARPLPPISLKLAKVSPTSTWPREEIYGDDGR